MPSGRHLRQRFDLDPAILAVTPVRHEVRLVRRRRHRPGEDAADLCPAGLAPYLPMLVEVDRKRGLIPQAPFRHVDVVHLDPGRALVFPARSEIEVEGDVFAATLLAEIAGIARLPLDLNNAVQRRRVTVEADAMQLLVGRVEVRLREEIGEFRDVDVECLQRRERLARRSCCQDRRPVSSPPGRRCA